MTVMVEHCGTVFKMKVELANPVEYTFLLSNQEININDLLGCKIDLTYHGNIHCIHCERKTNKSFQQGYCYPCFRRLQECNMCIIHPERCLVEERGCPEDDWAHRHCHQKHIIYLANSSGLKVGITRHNNVPSRWIDQGACQALPICEVQNRRQAGRIEVAIKQYVSDRTDWRKMLRGSAEPMDLVIERDRLLNEAAVEIKAVEDDYSDRPICFVDESQIEIEYPVLQYPEKVKSISFDKSPNIQGVLQGIKGQYLIFDSGVLNIRNFGGYELSLKCL